VDDLDNDVYLATLRSLAPAQRLWLTFELTEFSRSLFKQGLKERFPGKSDAEIEVLFLERIDGCHNRNY
jgi:hypothetical protein